ncbi:MAG: methyltransferase domain-containing protein [Pseudomonadota bacterium]
MKQRMEQEYVLGTHDEEIQRLGLQHRVWRSKVLDCWHRSGIREGSRVLDIGAGPGYATLDLAEIVGSSGQIIAVERSNRFVEFAQAACRSRGFNNVQLHELDLMSDDSLPAEGVDAAWCRWVASFVSSPATLIKRLATAIKPGGVAIFHEYVDYSTWRLAPPNQALEEFVNQVMESWRSSGGEPNIALQLPSLLAEAGFTIRCATPQIFCASPADYVWQWPASFININLKRLLELGRVSEAWVTTVRHEFAAAASNPSSLMLTPMVLEIIAERNAQ